MATHSSILAWRIPWTQEPGRLGSMVFQRGGHDWSTNTCTFIPSKGHTCVYRLNIILGKRLNIIWEDVGKWKRKWEN